MIIVRAQECGDTARDAVDAGAVGPRVFM